MTEKPETVIAALSLGGNTGPVAQAFRLALATLDAHAQVQVVARSSVWRTPPWGKTDQPDFLNMAALVETGLPPHELLALCLSIERTAGRERDERWGPRPLDIDIIACDDRVIDTAGLTLPHPRTHERAFVLVPLAEIAPALKLRGTSVVELAAACDRAGMSVDADATQAIRDN